MSLKKWMSLLTAASAFAGITMTGTAAANSNTEETSNSIKIMCVGDSITHGYIDMNNGYRKYLCYNLQQEGVSYDMVGPENNWANESDYDWNGTAITYDPAHCGYSGYSIMSYNGRNGIYEVLFGGSNLIKDYDPDAVLLQIGTNDLLDARMYAVNGTNDITSETSALERLERLVDEMLVSMDSSDMLFLASVPDIDAVLRSDWLSAYGYLAGVDTGNTAKLQAKVDEYVNAYNAGVKALAEKKQSEGCNVRFADINSVVDMKTGLYDGVHPNEDGYAAMGKLWSDTLKDYLNGSQGTTETTAKTETTVTEETSSTTTETTVTTGEVTMPVSTSTSSFTEIIKGDVNDDGCTDMLDVIVLRKYLVGITDIEGINKANSDMDDNEKINIFDAVNLLKLMVNKY